MCIRDSPRCAASADRICQVLDTDNSIKNPEQPRQSAGQKGCLTFLDVSFYFPGAKEPAVSHVSFEAKPGETTAVIGSTGSGKTCLLYTSAARAALEQLYSTGELIIHHKKGARKYYDPVSYTHLGVCSAP